MKINLKKTAPTIIIAILMAIFSYSEALAAEINPEEVISLANKARKTNGLPVLIENKLLNKAAADKAKDMLDNDYFAHTSPAGFTPWHWLQIAGYEYKYAGENLAINYDSAASQQNDWMKSRSHRDNILNSRYMEIGVAVAKGKINGETSYLTVQIFGTPINAIIDTTPQTIAPLPKSQEIAGEADIPTQETAFIPTTIPLSHQQTSPTPQFYDNSKERKSADPFETGIIISIIVLLLTFLASASVVYAKFIQKIYLKKGPAISTLPMIISMPTSTALIVQKDYRLSVENILRLFLNKPYVEIIRRI